jgi:hypothetical protein
MQRATVIIGHQREFSHARGIEIMRTAKNAVWLLYVLCPFLTLSHPLSEKKIEKKIERRRKKKRLYWYQRARPSLSEFS